MLLKYTHNNLIDWSIKLTVWKKSNPVLFLRVPILCDFEPLHQHVRALHNLVKAAQSLDEMSQTITDLLNEQKVFLLFFISKKDNVIFKTVEYSQNIFSFFLI